MIYPRVGKDVPDGAIKESRKFYAIEGYEKKRYLGKPYWKFFVDVFELETDRDEQYDYLIGLNAPNYKDIKKLNLREEE